MALFKNLYLDLSYLNPFKKQKSVKKEAKPYPVAFKLEHFQKQEPLNNNLVQTTVRDLPTVSSRLLDSEKIHETRSHEKKHEEIRPHSRLPPKELKSPKLPASISTLAEKTNSEMISEKEPSATITNSVPSALSVPEKQYSQNHITSNHLMQDNASFFSDLYSRLSAEENYMHNTTYNNVLNNNLFEEMQNFWHNKKDELGRTAFTKAVKNDLMKKMSELQSLEIEWQKLQLQQEKLKDELASKEMIIENNTRQLKKSFKKLHLSMEIKPEHYFVLADGKKLKNLQELYDNVKFLDTKTFSHHVNDHRNDFSTWVKEIMGLSELSSLMKEARTKEELYHSIDKWYNSG